MAKAAKPRKKGGHEEHEEHVNHERWLVSYADMLTLLFVLFVVLYSMSNVDKAKYAELAAGLKQGFGAETAALQGNVSLLDGSATDASIMNINPGLAEEVSGVPKTATQDQIEQAVAAADRKEAAEDVAAARAEAENLEKIKQQIDAQLKKAGMQDSVKYSIDARGLIVTVVTNEVVFAGNKAELRPGGAKIIDSVAPALKRIPNNVEVDGHTNQLGVGTGAYPSGWELSSARASSVVRKLIADGIPAKRLMANGFADTRPLIDPKDPRSVTMNRRVDVIILTTLPADQAQLLPTVAGT
ncbi:flagellar motor protein MotB [Catenuloplanes atrovinosus]|uniref:Chemotaxis protein MotB n=1 Tax=Catenuloplanes atrovinosus TaxID=137266 RepID=A0AAE3YV69_9ACTN|nr:flagellar motor protein MotB [Catenuloplanes atrovinosus]MDR7280478.1 chemotaxis protein MotB [Catenuloplanes atrovinosus]